MSSKISHNSSQCELCGKVVKKTVDVVIEGSALKVCNNCANFGQSVVIKNSAQVSELPKKPRKIKFVDEEILISRDYSNLIKQAREKLNIKQKALAEKIGERESVIHNLESGQLEPSMVMAKKLENFLNIKLIEKYEETKKKINFSDSNLTIGDLIKFK